MPNMKVQRRYIVSINGCMLFVEIIFAAVVVGLILWEGIKAKDQQILNNYEHYLVPGEQYTLLVACASVVCNFLFLFIFCLSCHTICGGFPCFTFASLYYLLALIAWLIAGAVEVYAAVQFREQQTHDVLGWKITIPNEQLEEVFRRRAAAAAFCFANGLLYIVTVQQSRIVETEYIIA